MRHRLSLALGRRWLGTLCPVALLPGEMDPKLCHLLAGIQLVTLIYFWHGACLAWATNRQDWGEAVAWAGFADL